jgi:hypothetical protein
MPKTTPPIFTSRHGPSSDTAYAFDTCDPTSVFNSDHSSARLLSHGWDVDICEGIHNSKCPGPNLPCYDDQQSIVWYPEPWVLQSTLTIPVASTPEYRGSFYGEPTFPPDVLTKEHHNFHGEVAVPPAITTYPASYVGIPLLAFWSLLI